MVAAAYGQVTAALVGIIAELTQQVTALEDDLTRAFEAHPDAEILRSLPGLGVVLGARVLAEFGDDPTRYGHPKARKAYAGTARSPAPPAPPGRAGPCRPQQAPGRRLLPVGVQRPFPLTRRPGLLRPAAGARGTHHQKALRALANRLVGILHGCLRHRTSYDEQKAWSHRTRPAAA